MTHRIWLGRLALSLTLVASIGTAFADDPLADGSDAVMPYTASELPVMATTPNLVFGSYGPQILLDAPTFTNIPQPIYLDKGLESQLGGPEGTATVSVGNASVEYNELLNLENQSIPLNKSVGLEDIKGLAKAQMETCQAEGFVCDAAISLKDSTLLIALTPMMVDSVEVGGEEDARQQKALRYLTRFIPSEKPLKLKSAERQLRLIHVNPDLKFETELEPIPYSHQLKVRVNVTEKKNPNHLIATWNNLDQPIFGRQFGALTAINNNLTGHGDSLMIAGVQGYRSTGVFSHYEVPVTNRLRPYLEASWARINPFQQLYTAGDTHGWAMRYTGGLKYVLYDSPRRRLSADVNFDFKQAYSKARGGDVPLEREAVRTIRGGLNYDQKWDTASLSMRHEFAGGIPIFAGSMADSDDRLSWFQGGSQYFRYTGFATVNKSLPLNSTLTLNTQWQFTPDGLSNFDVGGLGGTFYGRGYREVYLFVDNYTITSLQWQVPASFLPKKLKLPFSDKPMRETTSLLAFADYGYGWISEAPNGVDSNDHILSAGVGIRSQITNRISGRLDIGFPFLREPPFSMKPRLHFGMDVALF